MKISVKYGLALSAIVISLKIILGFTNQELRFAVPELIGIALIFLGGLIICIYKTQETEYQGAANPMELLKAGFIASALFSMSFSLASLLVKITSHDLLPTVGQLVFGLLFFFVFILIVGGMLSVFIAYFMSKKK
jgi:hypothetical protein